MDGTDPEDPSRLELRRLLRAAESVPSVDDPTWTALLLAYLEGRSKAAWILGDYLEGERAPALWLFWPPPPRGPRVRSGDLDQRLRYVLALLPPVVAHGVACDFVQHLVEVPSFRPDAAILRGIEVKRRWLRGEVTDATLKAARWELRGSVGFGREAVAQAMASSPSPSVAQRVSRLVASAAGRLVATEHGFSSDLAYAREIRWQAAHLRTRLAGTAQG